MLTPLPVRRTPRFKILLALPLGVIAGVVTADEAMVNYEDHVKPIFREHCVACHSDADRSSGLSLESYASAIEGGSGGASLSAGDAAASRLWRLVNHEEQPTMPPDEDRIAGEKLTLIRTWIEQGLPENSGSKIKRKAVNVAAVTTAAGTRPEGPLPLPGPEVFCETPCFTPRPAAIAALAASPWAPLVAIGGQQQVVMYHTQNGKLLGVLPFPAGEPQSITFSRDGALVLVGGGRHGHSGSASLYEIATGRRITTVGDEIDIVLASDINHDNTRIAIAGPKRVVRVFDTATGDLVYELKKHTDWIQSLRFSPDGILLASGDRSNALVVWEADTGRVYMDLPGHKDSVRSLAWRQDSVALYSGSMDGTVKLWDMNNGQVIRSWDAHAGGVTAVDVCNDGTLATTGRDGVVKLWDAAGNAAGEYKGLAESGMEVAVGVDSQAIVAGDWTGQVKVWSRADPAASFTVAANPPTLQMRIDAAKAALAAADETNRSAVQADLDELLRQQQAIPARAAMLTAASARIAEERSDKLAAVQAIEESLKIDKDRQQELDADLLWLQQQMQELQKRADQVRAKREAVASAAGQKEQELAAAKQQAEELAASEASQAEELADLKSTYAID